MWNDTYFFVKEFQTLIAGLLAVLAGVLAYIGINKQVRTALEIDQRNQDRLRRGTASAIAAEVLAMAIDIQAFRNLLKTGNFESVQGFYRKQGANFPVFDTDPTAVKYFPPHLANDVVQMFRDYRIAVTLWASDLETANDKERLLDAITQNYDRLVIKAVSLVVSLHEEAGMHEQETLKLWTKDTGVFDEFPNQMREIFGLDAPPETAD